MAFCDSCGHRLAGPVGRTPDVPRSFAGDRYEVERLLGEGGKKVVYLARDTHLDRDVAIALIKIDGLDETALVRIRREARAMGRLVDHPNIVTVYDINEEHGHPYIVSQYMAGGSVDDLLDRSPHHRLPLPKALDMAVQICGALEYAHARGIVHRDLKPANVWITADGTVKLGDFGLAMALDLSRVTAEGMMVGTVAYMSPEQALGRPADPLSDLYSLGAMLYELVCGRPPFIGDDAVGIISQHINSTPVSPSWHLPELPPQLESLICNLLAKAPDDRPAGAAQVRDALDTIRRLSEQSPAAPKPRAQEDRPSGESFVGRSAELDVMRGAVEQSLSGRGRIVMLSGESGMGKTRLVDEISAFSRLRGAQVLVGRCHHGGGAPAHWPWIQMIRAYVHEVDTERLSSEMGSGAADIAQVVSEVREKIPGLPSPSEATDPDLARFHLFDSVATFLKNASVTRPLVLALDDLHMADPSSLQLFEFVARELAKARLLLIGTYDELQLSEDHPLGHTLAEVMRLDAARRVHLQGLSKEEVRLFVQGTAGLTPTDSMVSAVYDETSGNPFFVGQIVRLFASEGVLGKAGSPSYRSLKMPRTVREVISKRLEKLSPNCMRMLEVAAVIGREFGIRLLETVSDLRREELLEALQEAVAAHVLEHLPRPAGRYTFPHALVRQTLYDRLPAARRMSIHERTGRSLESIHSSHVEPVLDQLAFHFFEAAQAGNVDKAIDYSLRAGDRAAHALGFERAVEHYTCALELMDIVDSPDPKQRCEILLRLGDATNRTSGIEAATVVFQRAAEIARSLDEPKWLARAALGAGGRVAWNETLVMDRWLIEVLEEALGRLGDDDSALRARVMGRLAVALYRGWEGADMQRGAALAAEALAMARRIGDDATLAEALRCAHLAEWGPDNLDARLGFAGEMVELAERGSDRELMLVAHQFMQTDLVEKCEMEESRRHFERWKEIARDLDQSRLLWQVFACDAFHALCEGRLDDAEAAAVEALSLGQAVHEFVATQWFGAQFFEMSRHRGTLADLEQGLHDFAAQYPDIPAIPIALALIHVETGRLNEARAELEELASGGLSGLPRGATWAPAVAYLAEVCAAVGRSDHMEEVYRLLEPFATTFLVSSGHVPLIPLGPVPYYMGLLASSLGMFDRARAHFEAAIDMSGDAGCRMHAAYARYALARSMLNKGDDGAHRQALRAIDQALDEAQAMRLQVLTERCLAAKLEAQGVSMVDLPSSIDAVEATVRMQQPDLRRHAAPDGVVTIVFSDIEGYTELTERLGDRRSNDLLQAHNAIVRESIAGCGGYEVGSRGDGFMLTFASARAAVRCAIDIQRRLTQPDAITAGMAVRIGIHTGEAIRDSDEFYGRHVNLAARIAGQARGGEILVSGVTQQIASGGEFSFGATRRVQLKGIVEPQDVVPVIWQEEAVAQLD